VTTSRPDGEWESLVVPDALGGERLDRVLATLTGCSRAVASAIVRAGGARLGGAPISEGRRRLRAGEVIALRLLTRAETRPAAESGQDLDIRFEDEEVLVVAKPAGLAVHPGAGRPGGTLVNLLLGRYPELAGVGPPARPGIVHRLDLGTSGLLLVARTPHAFTALTEQIAAHALRREYVALVDGTVRADAGTIDAPLGRSRRRPTLVSVVADGRAARTHYRVTGRTSGDAPGSRRLSLLRVRLETGRTHQIRVHLAAIGHPVAGDSTYGGPELPGLGRPFLHAAALGFAHPRSGTWVECSADLPPELREVLEAVGLSGAAGIEDTPPSSLRRSDA